MKPETPHSLIQSYVLGKWNISTAYRESSAAIESPSWYYETIVWEWDLLSKKRGKMVKTEDSGFLPATALRRHAALCISFANLKDGGGK